MRFRVFQVIQRRRAAAVIRSVGDQLVNLLAILVLSISYLHQRSSLSQSQFQTQTQAFSFLGAKQADALVSSLYRFDNPFVANQILKQLDIFEAVGDKQIKGTSYSGHAGGFKVNNNYCDDHRQYVVEHPELIFEQKKFVTNYWFNHRLRKQVIPMIGEDLHTNVGPSTKQGYINNMRIDANMFFTRNLFYYQRQVGKQFSCLSQASNHIPGHDKMYRKDLVGQALVDYAKRYESRPQCFNFDKYFPKTWVLRDKQQCLDFFEEFNSPRYQQLKKERNVVYFRKIGANVHEGKGVFPVDVQEEKVIRKMYDNGKKCGKVTQNNLIQYNVHNLLLAEKRKPGFRIFLLIASTNPVIAYYHDGYARLSLNQYDPQSKDKSTFVTNIGVNQKDPAFEGMTDLEINEYTLWFLDRFHQYLMEQGLVTDPNWLDNYLRPELKKVMIHLIRMSQDSFFKKSSVYELFGLDFVMDEDLKLWFIEANAMPLVNGKTNKSIKQMDKMLLDTFEIVYGLLKSRMKRVIHYVNLLTKEAGSKGLAIPNLQQRRQEFKELTKNRFEPEFEPSSTNGFIKIIDENEYGTKRYSNLINAECL